MTTVEDQSGRPEGLHAELRDAGLRATGPRAGILRILQERPGHHDVRTVAGLARDRLGSISTQAVYDVLAALSEAGLVRRIQVAGAPAHFEARVGDNHHHVVCRRCGTVRDVDCVRDGAPCLEPDDGHGFAIDEAEVTFWGTCPTCTEAPHAPTGSPVRPPAHE